MYSKYISIGIIATGLCASSVGFAKYPTGALGLPKGCKHEGYKFKHKMLHLHPREKGNADSVYFILNTSKESINIFQMKDVDSYHGVYTTNQIRPKQWAVYSSDEEKVKFVCTVSSPYYFYGKVVDCKDKLKLCEYTNVKYGVNNRGNYWMAYSTTRNAALKKAHYIGVLLTSY